jgi:hypothetical protein
VQWKKSIINLSVYITFEAFMAVNMKNFVFCDIKPSTYLRGSTEIIIPPHPIALEEI